MRILDGISVSPGVVVGKAFVIDREGLRAPHRRILPSEVSSELDRLREATAQASAEIERHRDTITQQLGQRYGAVYQAHLQMLCDQTLQEEIQTLIRHRHLAAETAVHSALQRYAEVFRNLENQYLAERAVDIFDVERRLLRPLLNARREDTPRPSQPGLVVAHDLTPGETANLDRQSVRGLATEVGAAGSHTAIIAAAMGIPAVVGLGPFLDELSSEDTLIIDGDHGRLILQPDEETLRRYQADVESQRTHIEELGRLALLPAVTRDGLRVTLQVNIEFPQEVHEPAATTSEGVGLFRTEFLYLGQPRPPNEDQQYQAYSEVLQAMGDRPVVFRTLDLGSDKLMPELRMGPSADAASRAPPGFSGAPEPERNPCLGLRSIRLSLRDLPLFRTQLRAVLRAGVVGNPRLMFPLISTVSELRQAKMVLADVKEDLEEEGTPFRREIPVGMMVETPAAAVLIDRFVPEVDFFSVGTNDLIQYTLAVDRGNTEVASLYNASDPALLRLVGGVVQTATTAGIPVSVCGQMSGNPIYTMLLLGAGVRQLSMAPNSLAEVKQVCRSVTIQQCRDLWERALTLENARDVTRLIQEELKLVRPDLSV